LEEESDKPVDYLVFQEIKEKSPAEDLPDGERIIEQRPEHVIYDQAVKERDSQNLKQNFARILQFLPEQNQVESEASEKPPERKEK